MSYSLAFAGDAQLALRALEVWLQEETLDELDAIAADPSRLPRVVPGSDVKHRFARIIDDQEVHVVSVTLGRNDGL